VTPRAIAVCLMVTMPVAGYAQVANNRPVQRLEVDAGGGAFTGGGLGTADANLRANETARRNIPLFSAQSRLAPAPTLHARAGFPINRRVVIEGGVALNHPHLRTAIDADAEGAPPISVVERIDQYVFEGGVVIMLDELRLGERTVPFAATGAGYVRQLHEGLTVIEHGQAYHVGAGMKHWFMTRRQGWVRAAGLRADGRLYLFIGGISSDDVPRPHGAISGSVFVSF
jgi:hypothetical protein